MTKKILLTFALLLTAVTSVFADFPQPGDVWDDATKTLTVNSNPGEAAYWNNTEIQHLVIAANVTSIGNYAFEGCSGLTKVTFATGSKLETIGEEAFNSTGLTSIEIPAGVTTIGEVAFRFCSGLTTVTFATGSKLETIGEVAFASTGLTSIEIPASVTTIDNFAFQECSDLATVTFASGSKLETIGEEAFGSCKSLNSVTIPASVTSIGMNAFVFCTGLTTVTFATGSKLETIGEAAFDGTGLTSITIPASVTSIGNGAFYDCSGLTTFTVFAQPTCTLGEYAFTNCDKLANIYVFSDLVTQYKATANWSAYKDIISALPNPHGNCGTKDHETEVTWDLALTSTSGVVTFSGTGAMADCGALNPRPWEDYCDFITSVIIEDGVTNVGDYTFSAYESLKSVTIPSSVTKIGEAAFVSTSLSSVTIPSNVTSIGFSAFAVCKELTAIEIPASVTTIDGLAFFSCEKLATVTFAAGSQLMSIGKGAFYGTSLTSIEIPASVTLINDRTFQNCSSLNTVTLNSNPYIGTDVFDGIASGATVTMNLTGHEGATGEYWMTFYNKNCHFSVPSTTQVFKAALTDKSLTLTELMSDKTVSQDNAVILKSTSANITLAYQTSGSSNDFSGNQLLGVSDPAGLVGDGTIYVLGNGNGGVGFYKLSTTGNLGVGKAYLTYSGGGSRNFFGFEESETTSIDGRWKMEEVMYTMTSTVVVS